MGGTEATRRNFHVCLTFSRNARRIVRYLFNFQTVLTQSRLAVAYFTSSHQASKRTGRARYKRWWCVNAVLRGVPEDASAFPHRASFSRRSGATLQLLR